jgi:hypothetical protein
MSNSRDYRISQEIEFCQRLTESLRVIRSLVCNPTFPGEGVDLKIDDGETIISICIRKKYDNQRDLR